MLHLNRRLGGVGLLGLIFAAGAAVPSMGADGVRDPMTHPLAGLLSMSRPGVRFDLTGDRVTTIYGVPVSYGEDAVASAEAFMSGYSALFGADFADLRPGTIAGDGVHASPMYPNPDGTMKFTLVGWTQERDGVPVFRSDVLCLVRNEPGNPVVMVRNNLRELGDFRVGDVNIPGEVINDAISEAELRLPAIRGGQFSPPELVIWAGREDSPTAPTLAVQFEGVKGQPGDAGYARYLIVSDARTGRTLYTESRILHVDVTGRVSGLATTGIKTAECEPEADRGMPYARVVVGSNTVFADALGFFTATGQPSGNVTATAGVRGQFFRVFSPSTDAPTLQITQDSALPYNFQFNAANNVEVRRAEVNAYIQANVVRDMIMQYAPTHPIIPGQTEFRVNVAVSGTCNAFYDGSSINFYNSGGGCANTAFYDVVHHEYGHHVVATGGSGQGQYGEGMSDCMGVLLSDQPILGYGFQNNCNAGIRSANNTLQYPCTQAIHTCGQLISGCLWDTRNELVNAGISNYRDLLKLWTLNSVRLHRGDQIAPNITIDWLVLDDNDANLNNGTPHYQYINAGFSRHNMPGPAIVGLDFSFPDGLPSNLAPDRPNTLRFDVLPLAAQPEPNSGRVGYRVNGGTVSYVTATEIAPNQYTANLPPIACNQRVDYFFSARSTDNSTWTSPAGAPTAAYAAVTNYDSNPVRLADNFQTNLGWTVTNGTGLTSGSWQRAIPSGQAASGRGTSVPTRDYDGSGFCFVTQNGDCDCDVDGGTTTLTSPIIDASGGDSALVRYARWYANAFGGNPNADTMVVQISGNGGTSWTTLETVGPSGVETQGQWFLREFVIPAQFATNQFRIRFTVSDTGGGSLVEAAIDDFRVSVIDCTPPSCPADFNGDGFADFFDFDDYVTCFESGVCPPGKTADFDGDGFVDFFDFDQFVNAFETGC
jgi:hypothetical protein